MLRLEFRDICEIVKITSEGGFQKACAMSFNCIHGRFGGNEINHPNSYFDKGVKSIFETEKSENNDELVGIDDGNMSNVKKTKLNEDEDVQM